MPIETKLTRDALHAFILDFYKQFGVAPYIGTLAGIFKVSKATIAKKLKDLEKEGKIKRLKLGKKKLHNTTFELVINANTTAQDEPVSADSIPE